MSAGTSAGATADRDCRDGTPAPPSAPASASSPRKPGTGITMLFLIGAPRSGTTMLERILSAHSQIRGGPEPHLLTPLAHLGVWRNVDKAPFDHIVAGLGQKDFISALPQGEGDYWRACRAYCDVLYSRHMAGSGKTVCLDKTPEYATVLPFVTKVFPDARYVVLTRHPLAMLSSFANSFFDGDYRIAHAHDPVLQRYVPAIAGFLRQSEVPFVHVRYEDLVAEPEAWMERIYAHLGVPHEAGTVNYAEHSSAVSGLGDPLGVSRHARPTSASLGKWADELIATPDKLAFARAQVARLDPADLEVLGYPLESLWQPLEDATARPTPRRSREPLSQYRIERKLIVRSRALVQRWAALRRLVQTTRLACDVLLREY